MKVVPFTDVPPGAWDHVCENSSAAWLFHRSEWVGLEQQFFVKRNLSFALRNQSGYVGVQPLYLSEVGIGWVENLVHCGIHRHTGLALLDELAPSEVATAWSVAMSRILTAADEASADRIQLNSQNLTPENMSSLRTEIPMWVREHGFSLGLQFGPNGMMPSPGMVTCSADQIVDLTPQPDALFSSIDDGGRRAIRKAIRHGLEFETGVDEGCISDYYALAEQGAARTGETLAPEAYFRALWGALLPQGRCAVLFACHSGRRVAALILAIDKGSASYLGGVSAPEFLPLRINDFLHWSSMLWAKQQGLVRYRLGPIFPELPREWPIARVSRFKAKFGGRSFTTIQGSLFLRPERYFDGAARLLSQLCEPRSRGAIPGIT